MGSTDLQPGIAIEGALVDEVGQRERRLERVANRVLEPAVAEEARNQLFRADRMDEDEAAELLGLGPHGMEPGVGELDALDATADRDATQAELLEAVLHLLDRKIGMLQRDGRKGD